VRRPLILLATLALLVTLPGAPAAAYETSDPNGMWGHRGYIVHNNMWNASGYRVKQTLYAKTYRNWYVRATADNRARDGAVKTYPNVHKDFHNWQTGWEPRLSSFTKIRSRFQARTPHVGIYNAAYDIWLNGVPGNREVMIWTENYRQVPAGRVVKRGLKFANRTWRVYATRDNHYLAFVPRRRILQGTLPIKRMLTWLVRHDRIPKRSTLGQIGFGFEIVSTGGKPARFKVSDFWVRTARR
jgi:hypothetical protein